MPLPYTGSHGELNFEADFVDELRHAGWQEVLKNKTVPELIDNWRNIIFKRNRDTLNDIPLSDSEMDYLLDVMRSQANTPVKANHFINGPAVGIKRDSDSPDRQHAGKEVFLDLFSSTEIAGGTSRYQIAEQTQFDTADIYNDRRGDITLLINGMPVIHIELKASGVDISEATIQIRKYYQEGIFRGFMGLVQVFWAISPEDALFFANPGDVDKFNSSFFFRWGDRNNKIIKNWKELISGSTHILSIPEAHKLIGYYCVADTLKDTLKICRSYQYIAIRALVKRASEQKWGDNSQLGGFIWCTTGGGKTMTSFKAGQLIIDMGYADKVVFVVDRKVLDTQSTKEYNSFSRSGENVCETKTTNDLFYKLKSSRSDETMIVTSMQKISRINDEAEKIKKDMLEKIKEKRIVFIIDEAHRSQFGTMHDSVKKTFYNALFFGFTGTPIFTENMKPGELITETVFGPCLAIYSLATGIRDKNVLGFWPEAVKTFSDDELKEKVALSECHANNKNEIVVGSEAWRLYRKLTKNTPMATEYDEKGNPKKDKNGKIIKGIEDYIPSNTYNDPEHRHHNAVVKYIVNNFVTIAYGEYGTLFHGILATEGIDEAIYYWERFRKTAPTLNVTALFNPNVNTNKERTLEHEKALIKIVDAYNEQYGTSYNRKTDPDHSGFKEDLTSRLAHKKPYEHIGNDHSKCIDIVIVVKQLLTGFDSQYVNILYLDRELKDDALIQAISRTNRVLDNNEKPWGMVKFFRKPYSMKRNLQEALKLYCEGDYADVAVNDLEKNIDKLNHIFENITYVFSQDKIENFECLPKKDENRQKFRREFYDMKTTMRAAMLQGLKWTNSHGKKLDFDEKTYKILTMRYNDLPSNQGGGGKRTQKPGFNLNTNISTMEMEKIDAEYLEAQFRILTMEDVEDSDDYDELKSAAIKEIKKNLGMLTEIQQRYAKIVLSDIENGILIVKKGKKFMDYIQEYMERIQREKIKNYADQVGLNPDRLFDLYREYTSGEVDPLKFERLKQSVDIERLKKYYNCVEFKARIRFHVELKKYIEERKADYEEKG